ncbi:hotdog family protein [Hymenobacter rubripertinctus]|uniref:3-hydroxyacyl-[acyl-carrier-protein] dehydratase FabZ n=1 Tax=Hymenobacter rubripertinctus TaxID=2029981 RepID=A0A418QWJ1_9BACT|nr:3-hydroxyacyl-[acyl-carrier-protein] dehydratase FabZ [Hymenobacter rubripertinctus]RIY09577.1 3-hydroxyacyl-[acyl-carrier-protein] dehydratase FabZ [Hymenobacter rubripertinctus]
MNTLLHNHQIQQLLPHRYPIQLVDRVVEFEPGQRIVALKAIGVGEPALRGHFPGFPIFPGVLLVEALGQTCALLLELTRLDWSPGDPLDGRPGEAAELGVLGAINVHLTRPVLPGAMIQLHAELDWSRGAASSLKVKARDEHSVYARGSIIVAMAPKTALIPA